MPVVNPGIRRYIGSAIQRLFNSASFSAPLTHSLTLERGTGTPTFTNATGNRTFKDHEGVLRYVPAGCARFTGARMVRNLLPVANADLTTGWTKTNCTVTTGVSDPNGGALAVTVTATGANAAWFIAAQDTSPTSSKTYIDSFYIRRRIGTGSVKIINQNGGTGTTLTITSNWTRVSVVGVGAGGINTYVGIAEISTSGDAVDVAFVQTEDITGRTDQTTPSEYVSVGVLSAPYHGAGVDGVEFFDTDLDGNPLTTLETLLAEPAATNLLLQSAVVATQSISVTAAAHTLSFKGTGTITLSGASTAGPLVGTGANDRVTLTFTPSAGSLTLTVSGSCTIGQLELGSAATSYIATTTVAVARNADVESVPTSGNIIAASGWIALTYTPTHAPSGTVFLWGTYVDASNYTAILHDATNLIFRKRIAGTNYDATIANAFVSGTTYKMAATWGASGTGIALNGTLGTGHANTTAAQIGTAMQTGADGNGANQPGMSLGNESIGQRQLSNSELQAITR